MLRRPPFLSHALGWTLFGSTILFLLAAVGVGAITYERAYENRIFPGVRIGPIPVGELSQSDAATRVRQVLDAYLGQGLPYVLDGKLVNINPIVIGQQDPDLSYALVDVNVPALVEEAYAIGRRPTLIAAWTERVQGATRDGLIIPLNATVASEQIEQALAANLGESLLPMEPPRLRTTLRDGAVVWEVTDGRAGRQIDVASVAAATASRIATLDPAAIVVVTSVQPPPYTKADVEAALPALDAALARAPLTLTHGDQRWRIEADTLAAWFTFENGPAPTLERGAIDAFLKPIADIIERPAENARLSINPATKRVREFQRPQEGIRIDRDSLASALHDAVLGTATPLIPIPVVRESPAVALADTNDLGIRELLGVGRTKFTGSPANRRHNIKIGAGLLHGVLIAPGEEFSTVGAVAPFTAETGYKTELVIKGNRTIPEYGGGLCQVSTTLFRTVLAAGLPVTERTNHAYRVPYYEPPVGMDATIYGPKPDFKFVNNTPAHLLLRTRIEGDELIYEFWGTNDGRVATTTEPEMFNAVAPPPMRLVETEDLPPGQKKCTERAHTGVDAKFTYTVTHTDGRKEDRVFTSHYRPWQAVCLIGKKPVADSPKPEAGDGTTMDAPASDAPAVPIPPPNEPSQTTPVNDAPPQTN
ncbi:MAG: VanW family protein [bacterium]|nr:VanW family protein [bacterium]